MGSRVQESMLMLTCLTFRWPLCLNTSDIQQWELSSLDNCQVQMFVDGKILSLLLSHNFLHWNLNYIETFRMKSSNLTCGKLLNRYRQNKEEFVELVSQMNCMSQWRNRNPNLLGELVYSLRFYSPKINIILQLWQYTGTRVQWSNI